MQMLTEWFHKASRTHIKLRYVGLRVQGFMDAICLIKLGKLFRAFGMVAFKRQKKNKQNKNEKKKDFKFLVLLEERLEPAPSHATGKHHATKPHVKTIFLESNFRI